MKFRKSKRSMTGSIGGALLGAMMTGLAPAFPDSAPRLPKPAYMKGLTGKQKRKAERRRINVRNWLANRRRRQEQRRNWAFQDAVNGLTNWQRTQWAKGGYPGMHEKDADGVRPFASLRRRA